MDFTDEECRDMMMVEVKGAYRFGELMTKLCAIPIIDDKTGSVSSSVYHSLDNHKKEFKEAIYEWTENIKALIRRKSVLEQDLVHKESQISKLIEKFEMQETQTLGSELPYSKIKKRLAEQYSYLEQESLLFLASAEHLAEANEKIYQTQNMKCEVDFSLSVVGYCKVVEYELRNILSVPPKKSVYEIINYIEECTIYPFCKYINEIDELRKERNGSAHTSIATIDKVKRVRELLFGINIDRGLLKMIEEAKKRKA